MRLVTYVSSLHYKTSPVFQHENPYEEPRQGTEGVAGVAGGGLLAQEVDLRRIS